MRDILSIYKAWKDKAVEDTDLVKELSKMEGHPELIEDAFYRELEFGTGGLRGVLGAGTNRMNIYVIRKATQGFANYLHKHFDNPSVAISYDSRIKSDLFAKTAAEVFAANDIKVHIYKELMPTPNLSYAVRELKCSGGIMVTASHNPSKYNGYKVYGSDGCQITTEAAKEILNEIDKINPFIDVQFCLFDIALETGLISYIDDELFDRFIKRVEQESVLFGDEVNKDLKIIYSPLNGTGLRPVTTILKKNGYKVFVVPEQEMPDGHFPTCPYPNPEIREAMELGIKYAQKQNADLFIATDPDCDRVGTAVKNNKTGEYVLISGNQMGVLLFDYICSQRIKHQKMPANPVAIKTIVTTDMAFPIAKKYGVAIKEVLTGFKFIGEQILFLEQKHEEKRYIFGFEESYGYLSGSYVRDKDAVNGVFLIAEMFTYYKSRGISLLEKLDELYKEHGYYSAYLNSYAFEGSAGAKKMQEIVEKFRQGKVNFVNYHISEVIDYLKGIDDLPKSNVVKIIFKEGHSVVIRPSGTEPKIKIYFSITGSSLEDNKKVYDSLLEIINKEVQ